MQQTMFKHYYENRYKNIKAQLSNAKESAEKSLGKLDSLEYEENSSKSKDEFTGATQDIKAAEENLNSAMTKAGELSEDISNALNFSKSSIDELFKDKENQIVTKEFLSTLEFSIALSDNEKKEAKDLFGRLKSAKNTYM